MCSEWHPTPVMRSINMQACVLELLGLILLLFTEFCTYRFWVHDDIVNIGCYNYFYLIFIGSCQW